GRHEESGLRSKRRRRAGADDLAGRRADGAEAVRAAAFEVVGVPGAQDAALRVHGYLQAAADDDAAFLTLVDQRHAAGVRPRLIALFQDLQCLADEILPDLPVGDAAFADLGQLLGPVEGLA